MRWTFLIFGNKSGAERSKPRIVLDSKVSEESANWLRPVLSLVKACSARINIMAHE